MTPLVTPLAPPARPGRAQDRPDPAGAAGFASALDGALSTPREPAGPSAAESRNNRRDPDERTADRLDRAADKAAAAADRAADKAARETDRAADAAARAADKAGRVADRPADPAERATAGSPATDDAAEPVTEETDDTAAEESAGAEATTGRMGLPAAVWALLMGRTTAPATAEVPTGEPVSAAVTGTPAVAPAGAPVVDAALPQTATAAPVPVNAAIAGDAVPAAVTGVPSAADVPDVAPAAVPVAPTTTSAAPTTGPAGDASSLPGLTVVTDPAATTHAAQVAAPADQAVPAAAPAADAAPASATTETAVPATTADSGTPGDPSSDDAGGAPAQQGSAVLAADAPETSAPVPVTGPVAGPAPVATAAPSVAAVDGTTDSVAGQPVGAQVARQVAVLRGAADGSHTMTLVLTPDTLGPVAVEVTVTKGALDLTLRGAHEHGRAALLDALPDLRRDLEQAGLSVTRAQVDRDTGGSRFFDQSAQSGDRQQAFGDRGGHGRGDNRSRPWLGSADSGVSGPTPMSQRSTSSGVDVRV